MPQTRLCLDCRDRNHSACDGPPCECGCWLFSVYRLEKISGGEAYYCELCGLMSPEKAGVHGLEHWA